MPKTYDMPSDFDRIFNGVLFCKARTFNKWFHENIHLGDQLKFTYCSNMERLVKFVHLGNGYAKAKIGTKTYYFDFELYDNSGASDCDIKFTYTVVSKNQIKRRLHKLLKELQG